MIQSGVLRIFRMAMRGLCSPSALLAFPSAPSAAPSAHLPADPAASPVLAVSSFRLFGLSLRPSARPPVRPFVLSPSVPSARLSIRSAVPPALSLRLSALSDPCLSFYPFCPPICPPIRPVPSASSLRLSALSDSRLFLYPLRSSRPPALTFLSAPPATCLPALRLSAHSSPSALSALSVCPVRLSARPAPEPPNFIPPISPSALFFLCGMIFPCPISDTLLKSRRGELGISDNNSYLWMQKMSFAHKNTTGYNEKS